MSNSGMQVGYVVLYVNDAAACARFWIDRVGMVEKGRKSAGPFEIVRIGFADQTHFDTILNHVAENQINLLTVHGRTVKGLYWSEVDYQAIHHAVKSVPCPVIANGDVTSDPVRSKRKDSGKGFKWDAVRFSHKVYAIFHAYRNCSTDWLVWMDADMVCHSPIQLSILDKFCPADRDLCFLGRDKKFSECGLYAMNLSRPATGVFLQKFQTMYDQAETGIFTLDEWHDSFVFDAVRSRHKLRELDWAKGIISGEGHPLINSQWGAYLDHLKGARKDLGRSKATDLKVRRTETYWTNNGLDISR